MTMMKRKEMSGGQIEMGHTSAFNSTSGLPCSFNYSGVYDEAPTAFPIAVLNIL